MKKITLIASAALLIGVTSCNNKQDFTSTSTYKLESYSLVIGPDQDAAVTLTNYTFITDNYNYTLMLNSDDLVIGGNKVDFGTTEMPMVYGVIRMSGAKSQTSFYLRRPTPLRPELRPSPMYMQISLHVPTHLTTLLCRMCWELSLN